MLRLEVSQTNGVPVIQVFGILDYGNTARFDEALRQALGSEGPSSLIIDLGHAPTLDSAGLGMLVKSFKTCQARGGRLAITGLNPKVKKLIGVTHLTGLFDIYETLAEGVAAAAVRQSGAEPTVPPGDAPLQSAMP